jgi:hypothetical protein
MGGGRAHVRTHLHARTRHRGVFHGGGRARIVCGTRARDRYGHGGCVRAEPVTRQAVQDERVGWRCHPGWAISGVEALRRHPGQPRRGCIFRGIYSDLQGGAVWDCSRSLSVLRAGNRNREGARHRSSVRNGAGRWATDSPTPRHYGARVRWRRHHVWGIHLHACIPSGRPLIGGLCHVRAGPSSWARSAPGCLCGHSSHYGAVGSLRQGATLRVFVWCGGSVGGAIHTRTKGRHSRRSGTGAIRRAGRGNWLKWGVIRSREPKASTVWRIAAPVARGPGRHLFRARMMGRRATISRMVSSGQRRGVGSKRMAPKGIPSVLPVIRTRVAAVSCPSTGRNVVSSSRRRAIGGMAPAGAPSTFPVIPPPASAVSCSRGR